MAVKLTFIFAILKEPLFKKDIVSVFNRVESSINLYITTKNFKFKKG